MPEAELSPRKDLQQSLPMTKHGRYTGMSIRWAILAMLAEDADGPMATGQIADALLAGGITSKGRHFGANVSAVLSKMNHERKEIMPSSNGWLSLKKARKSGFRSKRHVSGSSNLILRLLPSCSSSLVSDSSRRSGVNEAALAVPRMDA